MNGEFERILKTKAELLCWGIRPGKHMEEAYEKQNPFDDKRTGNAGVQLILGKEVFVNSPAGHGFCEYSPYELRRDGEKWLLFRNGRQRLECGLVEAPAWYSEKTSSGTPMPRVMTHEGRNTLITAVYNHCAYFSTGEECRFCAIACQKSLKWKKTQDLRETAEKALKHNPNYSMNLTGGNIPTDDRGLSYYLDFVRQARETGIKVMVEAAPPGNQKALEELAGAGVNAMGLNLEVWDDKLRKILCPGKSKIGKAKYFETWKNALELLGENSVCSVLLLGFEHNRSLLEGAEEMASRGVVPTLIPLRPNTGSHLENFRLPSPEEVFLASEKTAEYIERYGLRPHDQPGCTQCGACSLETDFSRGNK